ncbi:unnamed protein product, partial [Mesorhabditis belari]|uniref:HECT-type E3 ubiquitin transferase n=1 Tax=Mesorhabditis belari TaxID=2138241 RepID=A0AAF3FHJ2_9BILA
MKVDVSSSKAFTTDLNPACAKAISEFQAPSSEEEFIKKLTSMNEWSSVVGKTEMIRWVEVLDRMDSILERATTLDENNRYLVDVDMTLKNSVMVILKFTSLLFENTSTRSVYASTDRLLHLLNSDSMVMVIQVLQLFQCISKRSHFLRTKMPTHQQTRFQSILTAISQCWFSKLRVKMKQVVEDLKPSYVWPYQHNISSERVISIGKPKENESLTALIKRHASNETEAEEMLKDDTLRARLRVAKHFFSVSGRVYIVTTRMIAISTLIYSRLLGDDLESLFTQSTFILDCGEVAKISDYPEEQAEKIEDMRAEALRTLTSIAAQDKYPRLQQVIEVLGASSYHGFLGVLVRKCVDDMRAGKVSLQLCTALFSLLYHISSMDQGGEAIVGCGLLPTLLSVVSCTTISLSHISFVTRCVRVIDLVTAYDVQNFRQSTGMDICIDRLVHEVEQCRKEQPYTIDVNLDKPDDSGVNEYILQAPCGRPCHQQRSALIKSLLNFLKRIVGDNHFTEQARQMMSGNLPKALIHIISNADYYTASLFQNSIQLVTNFVYQEPQQLSNLQQMHLPFVILHSLLRKEIPAAKDVINNMTNTFTALCLNARGLEQLKAYEPFDHVFKIILSLKFITAMKRKRNDMNYVATGIGSSLDDLLRHHQSLRSQMVKSLMRVLNRLMDVSTKRSNQVVMSLTKLQKGSRRRFQLQNANEMAENNRIRLFDMVLHQVPASPQRDEESEDDDEVESDTNQETEAESNREGEFETDSEQAKTSTTDEGSKMDTSSPEAKMVDDTRADMLGLNIDTVGPDGNIIVPLGEYLLIFYQIIETMVAQSNFPDVITGLIDEGGVDLLIKLSQINPIRLQLAHSTLPQTMANILKCALQHSTNDELLSSVLKTLTKTLEPVTKFRPVAGYAGVLPLFGQAGASESIGLITYVTSIVGSLSKTAQTSSEDTRQKVLRAWTSPNGIELADSLNIVARVVSKELAINQIVQQSTKVTAQTQTDSGVVSVDTAAGTSADEQVAVTEDLSKQDGTQPEDAVITEAAPPSIPLWQQAGIHQTERDFWTKQKDIALLLMKSQKSLLDFPIQLTKACLKPQRNPRRYEQPQREQAMGEDAKKLADTIFKKYSNNIKATYDDFSPIMNAYGMDVIEQVSSSLFDERRQPSMPLLAIFYKSGCHRAFCQMLVSTIAPQFETVPGTSISLETLIRHWMSLADRLVNRSNFNVSRNRSHVDALNFPPEKYYRLVLTDLFTVFNQLFAVLRGDHVDLKSHMSAAEKSITVYKEVVRNLVTLRDEGSSNNAARATDVNAAVELVDHNHLAMLVEMGFERRDVVQALIESQSISEATDYLISNNRQQTAPVTRAQTSDETATATEDSTSETTTKPTPMKRISSEEEAPLNELKLDLNIDDAVSRTCNEMIPLCRRLMDVGSDLVYSSADLVIGVIDTADPTWRTQGLIRAGMCDELLKLSRELLADLNCKETARNLSTRLHFACLLWEDVAEEYIQTLAEYPLRETLIQLAVTLSKTTDGDQHLQEKGLIGPLLLWLDLYSKCSRMVRRKTLLTETLNGSSLNWSYYQFEERFGARGKFVTFDAETTQVINKAFLDGKQKIAFKMKSKEYVLTFDDMTMKVEGTNNAERNLVCAELPKEFAVNIKDVLDEERTSTLSDGEVSDLIEAAINIVKKVSIHHSVAHSVLLLLARLTLNETVANHFYQINGLRDLLQVQCLSSPSTSGLLTLIVRNCIDNQALLAPVYERSIRAVAGGTHNSGNTTFTRWNPARNAHMRDWRSSLNALQPLLVRDPELFENTMESIAKISDGKLAIQQPQQGTQATSTQNPSTSVETKNASITPATNQKVAKILEILLREVLESEWPIDEVSGSQRRMVSKAVLLTIAAELVRGYSCVASVLCELKAEDHPGHTILYPLIDKIIGDLKDIETHNAMRTLVATISSCNFASKAMDTLVSEVKSVITDLAHKNYESQQLLSKVSELANLVVLMREACPTTSNKLPGNREQNQGSQNSTNTMVRLLYRKKICSELARVLALLPLGKKESVETVNNVLRTLDELARSINSLITLQPNSSDRTREATVAVQDVSFSVAPDPTIPPIVYDEEHDSLTLDEEDTEDEGDEIFEDDDDDDEEQSEEDPLERRHLPDEEETNSENSETEAHHAHLDDHDHEEEMVRDGEENEEVSSQSTQEEAPEAIPNGVDVTMHDTDGEQAQAHEDNLVNEVTAEEESEDIDEEDDEFERLYEIGDLARFPQDIEAQILFDRDVDGLGLPFSIMQPGTSMQRHQFNANRTQDHPLLVRPTGLAAETARPTMREINERQPQRFLIERIPGRSGIGIQRTGAIRTRMLENVFLDELRHLGTLGQGMRQVLDRANLFAFTDGSNENSGAPMASDRRWSHASTALERLADSIRLLEPLSAQYLTILVNHIVVRKAEEKEKPVSETTIPSKELLQKALQQAVRRETEPVQPTAEEPMDTQEERAQVAEATAEAPMEQEQVPPVPPVENEANNQDEQDVAMISPSSESPMETTNDNQETPNQEQQIQSAAEALPTIADPQEANQMNSTAENAEQPTASSGMVRVPEQYRDILGDIEIPEGVDVEFMAALPEDLRQEILRDHARQQRAQNPTNPAPERAAIQNAPGVEPVDQEFLAALPADLQQEILAQHERAVREAQNAQNAQNADQPAANLPPTNSADDALALIESLAPALRAQVLADADDATLAALPPAIAAEARRLRNRFDREHAFRIQQRLTLPIPRRHILGGARIPPHMMEDLAFPAGARTTDNNTVQILDRDALAVLISLYFIDNPRFSVNRLLKVIRSVCSHPASCDFLIWAMLSLLEKVLEVPDEDESVAPSGTSSWMDCFTVSGNNDPAIKISTDGQNAWIHPQIASSTAKSICDTLINLSKVFPGHFLPSQLRNEYKPQNPLKDNPSSEKFWKIVADIGHRKSHGKESQLVDELRFSSLESSPAARLLLMLEKPVSTRNVEIQGKLLKMSTQIFVTLPNNTAELVNGSVPQSETLLHEHLATIVHLITKTKLPKEAIQDARTLLVEIIRSLRSSTSTFIFEQLYRNIESLASQLIPQISELGAQLKNIKPSSETETISYPAEPSVAECSRTVRMGERVQINRYDGERVIIEGDASGRSLAVASTCEELQLPAVSALTDKAGVQYALLQGLQTACKLRDMLRILREKRRKEAEETKKKQQSAQSKTTPAEIPASEQITESDVAGEEPQPSTSAQAPTSEEKKELTLPPALELKEIEERLSQRLQSIDALWPLVSSCLERLGKASDPHAVLALQPVAESFFLVHAIHSSESTSNDHDDPDTKKLIQFAEQHRSVLNQVLRQDPSALADGGPFTVLTLFPKLLDFDVKRKYFRKQLTTTEDARSYRREDVAIRVRRSHIFLESYRELFHLRPHEWKHRFYILFDGEEGQDAGGLLREWFSVITREIFNPNYALFITSPGDRVTYMINRASQVNPEHLDYFKFVGRIIGKAIYDNKLLDCYFTRAFYKHILNLPVRHQDLESEDPSFYNSLRFILENPINELGLDLIFSLEVEEFGVRDFRDLKPNGQSIPVTDENKEEYVKLVCQMKMAGAIRKQLDAFLTGFYEIIPKNLIWMFNEQELELLISGLPDVDIDDLAANTEYRAYTKSSPQIQWFWRALRSFEQEDRAKFLQFVTGTSKVPLQGFASLEGMNGSQKFSIHMDSRSGDRLPAAHTCFNQLDLPQYDSYEKLRECLLIAIRECTEGFGFA